MLPPTVALLVDTGAITVIAPNPALEVLYESEPDYSGVLGLWSLSTFPGATADALMILSFASGSRALSTGAHPCLLQTISPKPSKSRCPRS